MKHTLKKDREIKRLCKIENERWRNEKFDEIEELNKMHKSRGKENSER